MRCTSCWFFFKFFLTRLSPHKSPNTPAIVFNESAKERRFEKNHSNFTRIKLLFLCRLSHIKQKTASSMKHFNVDFLFAFRYSSFSAALNLQCFHCCSPLFSFFFLFLAIEEEKKVTLSKILNTKSYCKY
jgi:hypothetical protein